MGMRGLRPFACNRGQSLAALLVCKSDTNTCANAFLLHTPRHIRNNADFLFKKNSRFDAHCGENHASASKVRLPGYVRNLYAQNCSESMGFCTSNLNKTFQPRSALKIGASLWRNAQNGKMGQPARQKTMRRDVVGRFWEPHIFVLYLNCRQSRESGCACCSGGFKPIY